MKKQFIALCIFSLQGLHAQSWVPGVGSIVSTGNVGIGWMPNSNYPQTLLDVNGGFAHFTYNSYSTNPPTLPPSDNWGGLSIGWNRLGNSNAEVNFYNVYDNAPTSFLFSQKIPGANNGAAVDLLTIKGNGNVGIGTTNPATKLSLEADENQTVLGNNTQSAFRVINNCSGGLGRKAEVQFGLGQAQGLRLAVIAAEYSNYNAGVGVGGDIVFGTAKNSAITEKMRITYDGQVWIGPTKPQGTHSDFKFAVDGKIVAQSVYVTPSGQPNWADYVFDKDYKLPKLEEVEQYYLKNKHLSDIPTTEQVIENGIDLAEMNTLLLKKVEEITIYLVDLNKKVEVLQAENKKLSHK